jgi:putative hydrolase of the HAD superfamily
MYKNAVTDIFFDLDHTLWDFDRNSFLAFKRVFNTFGINLKLETFTAVYEPINVAYWKLYREDKVSKEQLRHGRLIDAFEHFEMNFSLQKINDMAVSYIDELPLDNHLFDGTIEILDYLMEKYTLHIITNGFEEVQHIKLKNSGIHGYFKTVTSSEEVGLKKPNPVIFKRALEKAEVLKESTLMIGDSFEADILGAEAFGMKTLFYNYRQEKVPVGYSYIDNLLEIKNHL